MGSLLLLVPLLAAAAGDEVTRDEADEAERLCAAELPRWTLTAGGVPLDVPKESVLKWTNPGTGRVYGNTYVWLQNGRPAAVTCLFRNFEPWRTFNAEFVALATGKLVGTRDGQVRWRPADKWAWQAVPGAPAPAASAAQRLVQMRALAGEFGVEVLDTRNEPRGENETPRLLPRPLYRYDPVKTGTLDGALYAFVLGTDPELLLLIECDTAAAKPEWRFGGTRMNRDTVRFKHKGATVWEAAFTRHHSPQDPYLFLGLGLPPKESKP